MNDEYVVKELDDFLRIPVDKVSAALRDFALWLEMRRGRAELEGALSDLIGSPSSIKLGGEFVWLDDGIEGISQIDIMAGGELIGSIVRPGAA